MLKDFILFALLPIIGTIGLFVCLIWWVEIRACEQKTESFAYSQYGLFSGCMVIHDHQLIPLDNIRWQGEET